MLPLVELADIFIDPGVRETIAITIYDAIAEAAGTETSSEKRERLAEDLQKYNDENDLITEPILNKLEIEN